MEQQLERSARVANSRIGTVRLDMHEDALYIGVFLVVLLSIVTWEVLRNRFVSKLKARAHDVWISVGSPGGLLRRLVFIDGFQLERFILQRRYRQFLPVDLAADADKLNLTLKVVLSIGTVAMLAIIGPFLIGK